MKLTNLANIKDLLIALVARKPEGEEPTSLIITEYNKKTGVATATLVDSCIAFRLEVESPEVNFKVKSKVTIDTETGEIIVVGKVDKLPKLLNASPEAVPAAPVRGRTPERGMVVSNDLPDRY